VPPVLFQPMSADDVASAVGKVAVGPPANGIVEIGGPEQFRIDELVRRRLAALKDPREVIADPNALYSGARITDKTLVPGRNARLGETRFETWLTLPQHKFRARTPSLTLRNAKGSQLCDPAAWTSRNRGRIGPTGLTAQRRAERESGERVMSRESEIAMEHALAPSDVGKNIDRRCVLGSTMTIALPTVVHEYRSARRSHQMETLLRADGTRAQLSVNRMCCEYKRRSMFFPTSLGRGRAPWRFQILDS